MSPLNVLVLGSNLPGPGYRNRWDGRLLANPWYRRPRPGHGPSDPVRLTMAKLTPIGVR